MTFYASASHTASDYSNRSNASHCIEAFKFSFAYFEVAQCQVEQFKN